MNETTSAEHQPTGRPQTPETKAKIAAAHLGQSSGMKGRTHTPENSPWLIGAIDDRLKTQSIVLVSSLGATDINK